MREEINNPCGILKDFLNNESPNTKRNIMSKRHTALPLLIWRLCASNTVEEE
jgi:hypothetical protein